MQKRSRSWSKTKMQVRRPLCLFFSSHSFILTGTKAKSQLTKANQTKTKMENLARELQKVRAFLLSLPVFCY
jgi:hypothetical protein